MCFPFRAENANDSHPSSFSFRTDFASRLDAIGGPSASNCLWAIAVWALRLGVQFFIFDAKPYLANTWLRLGYHALTLAFVILTLIYAAAAILPRAVN
ncbi:MAG: hypothetical protein MPJ50_00090 [Pirellulales bacterium]|nr:hypothetical protein [Pirellulales bacterium]